MVLRVSTTLKSDLYRLLPSVDELLKNPALAVTLTREGQPALTESIRAVLANLREEISRKRRKEAKFVKTQRLKGV